MVITEKWVSTIILQADSDERSLHGAVGGQAVPRRGGGQADRSSRDRSSSTQGEGGGGERVCYGSWPVGGVSCLIQLV